MARFPFLTCASSMKTTAAMFAVSTSRSPHATIGPKALGRRPRPDFTCSPGNRTTPNCAAFSTPRKSARGSLPYENPPHPHGSAPVFRLHGRGVPFPLPCGHAFRLFHLPAVSAVHQDEARQAQRRLCQEGCGKETRQLKGIPSAWPRLSSLRGISMKLLAGRISVFGAHTLPNTSERG